MRDYELTVIFRPEDDAYKSAYENLKTLMGKFEFNPSKDEDMGVRDLAYIINKTERGHYRYFEINTAPEKIAEFDRQLRLAQDVLKFLFVKKDA